MENFTAYNPTKLVFGKDVVKKLGKSISEFGRNVLLVYGKGSIKKNGVYKAVMQQLSDINANVVEFSGIKPNPIVDDVNSAIKQNTKNKIDVVLAVGGGSVIDSAKVIAVCLPGCHDAWDFMKGRVKPATTLPLINVLTLAATGTEMNPYAVLQNHYTHEKIGFGIPEMFPKYSFLDPQYTFSVPSNHTTYGIVDMIAHSLEAWFGYGECSLSDRVIISVIKEAMDNGPKSLKEPRNYDYRANLLLASTLALNGITVYGRSFQDWGVHDIGHTLSYLYDIPHGASLSVAYPAWLKHQRPNLEHRITQLGKQLFDCNTADDAIDKLEAFFASIDAPVRLSDLGIDVIKRSEILELMVRNKVGGLVHKLNENDYSSLVDFMM